jgi:AcrR family transcriptional regulator
MTARSLSVAEPPPRRRKDARPAEIVAAALAEFGARGFAAARMDDIARRAGAAKGTLFRYFPSKEALFEAAIASRVSPVFETLSALVEAHQGPVMPLFEMALTRMYAEIEGGELPVIIRIIVAEGHRFPAIVEAYHRGSIQRGQQLLRAIVARGVASGEFRASAVTDLPMVLMAPALMRAVWGMTFDALQPVPAQKFREAHLALIRGALLAAKA